LFPSVAFLKGSMSTIREYVKNGMATVQRPEGRKLCQAGALPGPGLRRDDKSMRGRDDESMGGRDEESMGGRDEESMGGRDDESMGLTLLMVYSAKPAL